MRKEFTVTLVGKGGRFITLINEELDFATHPYEVCLQEMVFTPGSWGNVRAQANWFIVFARKAKKSKIKTLYVPPRQYHSVSDLLYAINKALADEHSSTCHMFYYFNRLDPKSEIVFPHPDGTPDLFFASQVAYPRRFRLRHQDDKAPTIEVPGMTNKPDMIEYGGGDKELVLLIQFCQELAIMLGIITSLNITAPSITPRWTINVRNVNLLKNNLMMLWIFGDFVVTTMSERIREPILAVVPIEDDTKAILHAVFHMQDFVAVPRRKIQCFNIWIQEGPASPDVLPISEEMILVLFFRRIE